MVHVLGISCYYHDSAACLLQDGKIVAAAQEERFSRKKHDFDFPRRAIDYCLKEGKISAQDLNFVAFYEKPFLKFERILETYLAYAPVGFRSFLKAIPLWMKHRLWIPDIISKELNYEGKILFPEHHESHAASAFFPSPFKSAAILTSDGVGEWATTSFGRGQENQIQLDYEIRFPHSLGLLYSAFTYYTGFKVNSAEYKVMGLAPYGEPVYADLILKELIDLKEDGSFKLNMKYFNYCAGLTMTNRKFYKLFGAPPRKPETKLQQRDMDLARSVQWVTEEIMIRMANHVHRMTGEENLCLSGGVALNCVANGRILREGPFKNIWIQPAAGDAGGALGAALMVWHQYLGNERTPDPGDSQSGTFLGPDFKEEEIEQFLKSAEAPYQKCSSQEQLLDQVSRFIEEGNVIGWFQGRMEFGPRALGARSIIGDARNQDMQSRMNLKIKYRESFRPFAPSVLEEQASEWFEFKAGHSSPYMLLVADVAQKYRMNSADKELKGLDQLKQCRSKIPAVTHVDMSARLQTIDHTRNPIYYGLIKRFYQKTGCPVLINTSFNVRGEPIVCSPEDAFRCFMATEMDYLILGNFILDKKKQKMTSKPELRFELD